MNYTTAMLLINPKCRALKGIYEADPANAPGAVKRELFKTFDRSIKVDDLVIVPTETRLNFTVVKITDVDVEWEPETTDKVRWIVSPLDQADYQKCLDLDSQVIQQVKESERTYQRDQMREKLLAHVNKADIDKINSAVDLAKLAGPVIEQPPAVPKT